MEGHITAHHRFILQLIKDNIDDKEKRIAELESRINEVAKQYSIELENLQTIPGVAKDSTISIISEVGVNMEVFPNEHHLSSWAGVSPGNNESGGKKSTRTIHGNKYLQSSLVEATWGSYPEERWLFKTKIRKPCNETW